MNLNSWDDMIFDIASRAVRVAVWLAVLASGAMLSFAALAASPAPRAGSAQECYAIADLAITARALVEEGVDDAGVRRVLGRMYPPEMLKKWGEPIAGAARSDKRSASDFASGVIQHCQQNGGVMQGFFGVGV